MARLASSGEHTETTTTTTTTTRVWAERRPVARWLAVLPPLVGLPVLFGLGMGPTRHSVEGKLEDRTAQALEAAGITGVDVHARGRDIHLSGLAALAANDASLADQAHHLARSQVGVRHVFDGSRAATDAAGGALSGLEVAVHATGGKLVLHGRVGSEAARAALLAAAAGEVGAANVVDELTVDPALGEPDAKLADRIGPLLGALADHGGDAALGLSGGVVSLTGGVPTGADKDSLALAAGEFVTATGSALDNRLTIGGTTTQATTPATVPATTVAPALSTAVQPATTAPTAATPTTATPPTTTSATTTPAATAAPAPAPAAKAPAAARFVVYFDTAIDTPNTGSEPVLGQALAAAAAAAPGTRIQVIGFADATGDPALNIELSQRRADNVARILAQSAPAAAYAVSAQGVDASVTGDLQAARRVEIVLG